LKSLDGNPVAVSFGINFFACVISYGMESAQLQFLVSEVRLVVEGLEDPNEKRWTHHLSFPVLTCDQAWFT
jgi:hypothetical protein